MIGATQHLMMRRADFASGAVRGSCASAPAHVQAHYHLRETTASAAGPNLSEEPSQFRTSKSTGLRGSFVNGGAVPRSSSNGHGYSISKQQPGMAYATATLDVKATVEPSELRELEERVRKAKEAAEAFANFDPNSPDAFEMMSRLLAGSDLPRRLVSSAKGADNSEDGSDVTSSASASTAAKPKSTKKRVRSRAKTSTAGTPADPLTNNAAASGASAAAATVNGSSLYMPAPSAASPPSPSPTASASAAAPVVVKKRSRVRANEGSPDSVRVYLREIGQTKLLTADEEIQLSREIQDLLELERRRTQLEDSLGREPTRAEWAAALGMDESALERRLVHGRMCKDKMIRANLRLVVSIAKKYINRGLTFQDLIQEGSMGLIRGAEKFDHEKGFKFSTYAHWWIRQAITRAIADQSRTIRLPVHLFEIMSRIKKNTKTLAQEFGRPPVDEEIAASMCMTVDKLQGIFKASQLPLSLEAPLGSEEKRKLEDVIEANIETPEDNVARNLLKEDLENVLNTLNPRERDVLRLRYGLEDGQVKTLEEIGNIFTVTRERIRQIEAKALRKLRQPSRNSVLREYLET
eukprot:jgi/Mesvir1/15192/Mv06429-RA.2